MTALDRFESRCRLLLLAYPRRWRARHEDEVVGVLLDQAQAEGRRSTLGFASSLDLVGHGLEERVDVVVRWLPERFRRQAASAALVAMAGLSFLFLVGEAVGARARPPADEIEQFGASFGSGPFLTIGVGLYLAGLSAALLVALSRPGLARALLLPATAFAGWMALTGGGPYPVPRASVLVMFVGLGLLASLATLGLDRPGRRRLVGAGAGFVTAVVVGLLLTEPLLGWSVGTFTTSGNVAAAALAVVLPVLGGVAVLVAATRARRHPGWSAALAVAALPVVLFCTGLSVSVNPVHLASRSLIPLAYALIVTIVAVVARRRRLRPGAR